MRARVNDRLARAVRFPVTLVVAPAGFGKSVALRDFIASARLDALRYDVRREENTLLAFARGLSDALEPVAPSVRAAFPAMQERILTAADPAAEIGAWFAEHLRRAVCTVVIDDLHNGAADPQTTRLLVDLVDRTRDRIRWIVASRSDADLPVATWIGYGRMDVPIGEDDLRFTLDEALAAADDGQQPLCAQEVETILELTSGWPVALGIALRVRMHSADLRSAASGTREMVSRYLAEQVFARLTRAQQRFLLDSCVFSSFDDAIAEALGVDAAFLTELRGGVTLLSAVAPGQYRYHDLFRDFLERELRRSGAGGWYRALRTGGEIVERQGRTEDALALFTRAGDADGIVRVVERDGFRLLERGGAETVAAALDIVPEDQRRENASVLGVRAVLEASRGHFAIAEGGFVAAIDRAVDPALRVALVHRYAIELVRHERDCIAVLEPYARDASLPAALRLPLLGTLATAYIGARRVADALATIDRALDGADALDGDVRARLYHQAAYVHQFAPSRERVRPYASLAVELALARNLYELAARAYSALYTIVYDESDDPIAILAVLDKLLECARKGASRQARAYGLIASYEIEVERGDDAAIERLESQLADEHGGVALLRDQTLLPAQALRAAWERDWTRAYELLADSAEHQDTQERRALRAAELALYACAAGRTDAGEAALQLARTALETSLPTSRRAVRARLFIALAELVRGHAAAAHRHLGEAERLLTPPMRRQRALARAIRALAQLQLEEVDPSALAAALERMRSEHVGGLARLLAALPLAQSESRGYGQLTPSEREILRHLASGASTKEIASRTGRSPQTIDTHVRSICRKLRCSGRREAVAVALGAGWISPPLTTP